MSRTSFATLFVFATLAASSARAADPEIGKTARYCNPLPMVTAPGGNAAGDVTVIREQGKYYMYCTGGGAWISDDLLNWSFQRVANVPVAPHVVKYNGSFYMCGNSGPLFKADNPLGPFTSIGQWKNTARRCRWMARPLRHGHLHRRRQQAVSLLPRPRD